MCNPNLSPWQIPEGGTEAKCAFCDRTLEFAQKIYDQHAPSCEWLRTFMSEGLVARPSAFRERTRELLTE